MNNKLLAAISVALIAFMAGITHTQAFSGSTSAKAKKYSARSISQTTNDSLQSVYIIQLRDQSVINYDGSIAGISEPLRRPNKRLELSSTKQYLSYLKDQHSDFSAQATQIAPTFSILSHYHFALNGMAVKLTPTEAKKIAKLDMVKSVQQDRLYRLHTDRGPSVIGADTVWNGSGIASGVANLGEGVIVGIIDSGINTDHPSFAQTAGDGYQHSNPWGQGVYVGDCAGEFANLCNNKLIGVHSYPTITNAYSDTSVFPAGLAKNGEDYGGHGTHVAGTAAGNQLFNVNESTPEDDAIESDGIESAYVFPQISGVAPRANIVSYQVCWGGSTDDGDTYGDCPGAAINAGIESAIQDQVDVINFSVSGGGQPWNDSTELAFLAARNAGIFVATSAGNAGPDESSTDKHAPWYTAVGASEHGRTISYSKQLNNFSGGSSTPQAIFGSSNSGAITASIVYAGDFSNPNDPSNPPEQCLEPFPAGTFNGQIVVCDRGEIARVQKAVNVRDGGAGGYVLANVEDGTDNIVNDVYVVPGIHITAQDASILRAWLASGSEHIATITASQGEQEINQSRVDTLASFSSRGPNSSISTLTPTLTAPGVDIYAAYADQQFGHDGGVVAAGDYSYLEGTSMSSPHVAGAAALVKAAHPSWTPDNIRSALASTASTTLKVGSAAANWFEGGSGRIQVASAIDAGLVMDETAANYAAADPNLNGEPRALNLPSITDGKCVQTCTWSRTFTAAQSGDWSISSQNISGNLAISATPQTFSLSQGQSQTVSFAIDASGSPYGEWSFGQINLVANGLPTQHLPVSVMSSIGDFPDSFKISAQRDHDSFLLNDINTIAISNFSATPAGLIVPETLEGTIAQDSNNDDYLDDLSDGVVVTQIDVAQGAMRVVAEVIESSSDDLDLFLVFDANNDGVAQASELVDESTSAFAIEKVSLMQPEAGTYWIIVQNWQASNAKLDTFTLLYGVVDNTDNQNLQIVAPSSIQLDQAIQLRLGWQLPESQVNDRFYGAALFGATADSTNDLAILPVDITRVNNDVSISSSPITLMAGNEHDFIIQISPNPSPESRDYTLSLNLPEGISYVPGNSTNAPTVDGNTLRWQLSQAPSPAASTVLPLRLKVDRVINTDLLSLVISSSVTNSTFTQTQSTSLADEVLLDAGPRVRINNSDNASIDALEGRVISIESEVLDPLARGVSYAWTQVSGPSLILQGINSATISVEVPTIDSDQNAVLELSISDDDGRKDSAMVTLALKNNQAPTLNIQAPSSVSTGANIQVSVSASDPENDQVSISINGQVSSSLNIVAPSTAGTVSVEIVADDGFNQVTQTLSISVTAPAPIPSASSGGGGGGGSIAYLNLMAMLLLIAARRRPVRYTKAFRKSVLASYSWSSIICLVVSIRLCLQCPRLKLS